MIHSIGLVIVALLSVVVGFAGAAFAKRMKQYGAATVFCVGYVIWLVITLVPEGVGTDLLQVHGFEVALTLMIAIVISLPFYALGFFLGHRLFGRKQSKPEVSS